MSEAILTRRRNFKKNYDNLFGLKWEQSNFLGGQYTDIAYGDGLFVISCDRDFSDTPISGLLYSTDGKEWHQSNIATGYFSSVAYGDGAWVAGAYYGYESNIVGLWYSIDGKTWTQSNVKSGEIRSVTYGNGTWVALGYDGNYYSKNGSTWTSLTPKLQGYKACYSNGLWLTGNNDGIYYSSDGVNWTQSNITTAAYVDCAAYGNGIWAIGAYNGIYYSTDGKIWTEAETDTSSVESLTYGKGVFVATDINKGAFYSTDGQNWDSIISTGGCRNVVFADGYWILGGSGIWASQNGVNWIQSDLPVGGNVLRYANKICVAACYSTSSTYPETGLYYSILE